MCYVTFMKKANRTIAYLNDLSLAGGCSTAAALPVIAALGCECIALPTAVYSTHTGGFGKPVVSDQNEFIARALDHFKDAGVCADALLSGYMASPAAAQNARKAKKALGCAFCVHDPAFADGGGLYSGMTSETVDAHRALAADSDLVLPNVTEALVLAGEPADFRMSDRLFRELARRLSREYRESVVTGLATESGSFNAVIKGGDISMIPYLPSPGAYPGTGDLFAAIVTSRVLNGHSVVAAVETAAKIVKKAIDYTNSIGTDPRFGVSVSEAARIAAQEEK